MRYLPSLGVQNIQLIKGKKRRKGFLNHSKKKKKKKKKERKPNLRLNTVTQRRGNQQRQKQR